MNMVWFLSYEEPDLRERAEYQGVKGLLFVIVGMRFHSGALTAIHLSDLKTQCCDWMVVIKMFPRFQAGRAFGFTEK